jgi:putative SOS response-associated peptidase YedK
VDPTCPGVTFAGVCGRATLTTPAEVIAEVFDVDVPDLGPPRFNVAPTQPVPLIRKAHDEGRELVLARWGLVPWWAKPDEAKRLSAKCIQARSETLQRAPAFRDAWRRHRGIVVIDGFYEWRTLEDGRRVPHHVRRIDRRPFAVAGLWDDGVIPGTAKGASCAVVTTRARGPVATLHDRMPLALEGDAIDAWLASPESAAAILSEAKEPPWVVVPVSTWVNDVRHDDPRCLEPASGDV